MSHPLLSRRGFLRQSALGASAALLAACAPQVVKETVVVEREVEKEVTTVIEVEKEIEKEVTRVIEVPAETPQTAEEILGPDLMPGDPDHPSGRGWRTTLPDVPPGVPFTPPVVVRTTTRIDAATQFWGGDTLDDNIRTRFYKKLFGIDYRVAYTWSTGEEAEQRANLAMASGDLPDFFTELDLPIFYRLLEGGMLQDITETYDAVADDRWIKEAHEWGGHILWRYAEVDGRKMGFPRVALVAQDEAILFIRDDWLDKLGLEDPTTIDELGDVAKAFVENDMGEGAPGTTVGVCLGEALSAWYGGVDPVFGGYGVQPTRYGIGFFTDDGQGRLKFDGIDPHMKEALTLLRQWYADGIIAKDFFTKDTPTLRGEMEGNRCGILFTHPGGGVDWCARGSVTNDPEARWKWIDVPAGPVRKGKNWFNPCHTGVFVFRKGYEHVDKLIEQANFEAEIIQRPEYRYHGFREYDWTWSDDGKVLPGKLGHHPFGLMYTKGGTNITPEYQVNHIAFRQRYAETVPREEWDAMMEKLIDDPTGLQQLMDTGWTFMAERSQLDGIKNRWLGRTTALMQERWATLNSLTQQTYLGLISGELPLDAFERYADEWRQ